jgi:hypothetical protein
VAFWKSPRNRQSGGDFSRSRKKFSRNSWYCNSLHYSDLRFPCTGGMSPLSKIFVEKGPALLVYSDLRKTEHTYIIASRAVPGPAIRLSDGENPHSTREPRIARIFAHVFHSRPFAQIRGFKNRGTCGNGNKKSEIFAKRHPKNRRLRTRKQGIFTMRRSKSTTFGPRPLAADLHKTELPGPRMARLARKRAIRKMFGKNSLEKPCFPREKRPLIYDSLRKPRKQAKNN